MVFGMPAQSYALDSLSHIAERVQAPQVCITPLVCAQLEHIPTNDNEHQQTPARDCDDVPSRLNAMTPLTAVNFGRHIYKGGIRHGGVVGFMLQRLASEAVPI